MKKIFIITIGLLFIFAGFAVAGEVQVKEYYRKDGTHVRSHVRSSPQSKTKSDTGSNLGSETRGGTPIKVNFYDKNDPESYNKGLDDFNSIVHFYDRNNPESNDADSNNSGTKTKIDDQEE